jgi:hypothetical protein
MDLLEFLRSIEEEVTSVAQPDESGPAMFRQNAFTQLMADELEGAGVLESPVVSHLERGAGAGALFVSGYALNAEEGRLDLFATIYSGPAHTEVPKLNAQQVDVVFRKLQRYLERALAGLHHELEVASEAHDMTRRIHDLGGAVDRVNLLILTNSQLVVRKGKERVGTLKGMNISHEIYDLVRLRRLRESGRSYEAIDIDLSQLAGGGLPCIRLDESDTGYRTSVAIFPGTLLHQLYDDHGARLMELNVRSYLQARGAVNKGILATLRDNPGDFMAYNNGITVVAEEVGFAGSSGGNDRITALRGLQIVNGGQTTASIHKAGREGHDLSRVFVQGKVVTIDPARFAEVVPLISRYANSQNKVTEPDLQSNNPFHVGMERASRKIWTPGQKSKWFYERARGSYETLRAREGLTPARKKAFETEYPPTSRFNKEDLARYEMCWYGMPHIVNLGRQKNFTQYMTRLKIGHGQFSDGWEPTVQVYQRYIAEAIIWRDVDRLVRLNTTITGYRVNVTNYTVAMMAERTVRRIDLDAIWMSQSIGKELSQLASQWAERIFQELLAYSARTGKHTFNILTGEETWLHLLDLDFELPESVTKKLIEVHGENIPRNPLLTTEDQDNAARCREVTPDQWKRVMEWGAETGELNEWQVSFTSTLLGYATLGWRQGLSSKQAKQGVKIITAARKAGLL